MKAFVVCVLPLLLLLLIGCKSTNGSPSSRLASVVIKGHSAAEITLAAQRVFTDNGYRLGLVKSADLVFEKPGSGMNTLVYGDWSGKSVWFRVKVYLRDLGPTEGVLLDCDAFRVLERGDALFEEEKKLTKVHHGTYQELMNKVSQRLQ